MANAITYSTEVTVTKATRIARAVLTDFIEPSTGVKEATFTVNVAPGATETVALGDITVGTFLLVNAKVDGGTDDINGVIHITNVSITGVAAGAHDVRFGSYIVVGDANFTALSVSNLDTLNAFTAQIYILGN